MRIPNRNGTVYRNPIAENVSPPSHKPGTGRRPPLRSADGFDRAPPRGVPVNPRPPAEPGVNIGGRVVDADFAELLNRPRGPKPPSTRPAPETPVVPLDPDRGTMTRPEPRRRIGLPPDGDIP